MNPHWRKIFSSCEPKQYTTHKRGHNYIILYTAMFHTHIQWKCLTYSKYCYNLWLGWFERAAGPVLQWLRTLSKWLKGWGLMLQNNASGSQFIQNAHTRTHREHIDNCNYLYAFSSWSVVTAEILTCPQNRVTRTGWNEMLMLWIVLKIIFLTKFCDHQSKSLL